MAQQMNPKQIVNEVRRVRDDLNRIRTGLTMSEISDMDVTKKVVNDIDMLLADSDSLRNEVMTKMGM